MKLVCNSWLCPSCRPSRIETKRTHKVGAKSQEPDPDTTVRPFPKYSSFGGAAVAGCPASRQSHATSCPRKSSASGTFNICMRRPPCFVASACKRKGKVQRALQCKCPLFPWFLSRQQPVRQSRNPFGGGFVTPHLSSRNSRSVGRRTESTTGNL